MIVLFTCFYFLGTSSPSETSINSNLLLCPSDGRNPGRFLCSAPGTALHPGMSAWSADCSLPQLTHPSEVHCNTPCQVLGNTFVIPCYFVGSGKDQINIIYSEELTICRMLNSIY